MGKYSHLKDQITKFSGEPEYQQRVSAEKERIKTLLREQEIPLNAKHFGDVLVHAKIRKAEYESKVKEENLTIEAMNQILVDFLEGESMNSVKLDGGVSLTIKDDVYCSVADRESFYKWIKENGLEDLFTVNYQTMSSMVKQKLTNSEDVPPGINTYFKQSITVRGASNLDE